MDEWDIKKYHQNKPCKTCRAAMMTFFTEHRQPDGSWKLVRIVRNCGHTFDTDPQED